MIQLGQMRLLFREKATATKIGRPVLDAPKQAQAPGAVAMPSHLCPFCGATKDAQGNCLCNVPATPGMGMPPSQPGMPVYEVPQPGYGAPPPDMGAYGAAASAPFGTPEVFGSGSPFGEPGMPAPAYGSIGTKLTSLEGPYAGQSFQLGAPMLTIGRDPGKDIALTSDTTISRNHGHIANEGGQHVLYDDGSSNGTFVNNVRIQVQTLAPGDVVQLGTSKFRYE
jgi:hypothetical protein